MKQEKILVGWNNGKRSNRTKIEILVVTDTGNTYKKTTKFMFRSNFRKYWVNAKYLTKTFRPNKFLVSSSFSNYVVFARVAEDQRYVVCKLCCVLNCWKNLEQFLSRLLLFPIFILFYIQCVKKIRQQGHMSNPLKHVCCRLFTKAVNRF